MTVLNPPTDTRTFVKRAPRAKAPPPALASSGKSSRMGKIVSRLAMHVFLLSAVAIFLFPFIYMGATSLKTDEELTDSGWFPAIPHFTPTSPSVREMQVHKPDESSIAKWNQVLPQLRSVTRSAVDKVQLSAAGQTVDANTYRESAADQIINRIVPRLNVDLWSGDANKIIDAYKVALTPDVVTRALDDRLARVEFRSLQARSLDSHIYTLTPGSQIAADWKITSGNGSFIPTADSSILKYHFNSSADQPITIQAAFNYPADPAKLHKLMLALRPDDSWHRLDASLDFNGQHWIGQKTKYLGTTRQLSILFQPPSFDDTTDRRRIWVPLKNTGPASASPNPQQGILTLTVSPSSTPRTIWGKVQANYTRVFESIPFFRYVANSLWIVLLSTLGTLFSSSFVAYAFARLNWPGRGVAFALLLSTMMLPAQVTMIPSFLIWRSAGLYNTLCPLWIPAWFGMAFFIFLMVQHMRTLPRELEEAARIDGASMLRTWWQIILPETKPALAAIAIMVFMGGWNEFMAPLIYLRDQHLFPLSLGLYNLRLDAPEGGTDWTLIMAANVLMTLPVVLVFFVFQKYFVQGMTMTGMKG